MKEDSLSQKAIDLAVEAKKEAGESKSMQESHDKLCAVRYQNITTTMAEMKRSMDSNLKRIYGLHWKVAGFVIILLLSVVAYQHQDKEQSTDKRIEHVEGH